MRDRDNLAPFASATRDSSESVVSPSLFSHCETEFLNSPSSFDVLLIGNRLTVIRTSSGVDVDNKLKVCNIFKWVSGNAKLRFASLGRCRNVVFATIRRGLFELQTSQRFAEL